MSGHITPGTIVRYQSEREGNWCREGMAFADDIGELIDTYWCLSRDQDSHILTDAEQATVEVLFHVDDYRQLGRDQQYTWEDYHPADRQVITSQHGMQRHLYVRIGAQPHLGTRIENARDAVRKAEAEVASAERLLARRCEDLARLEAERIS